MLLTLLQQLFESFQSLFQFVTLSSLFVKCFAGIFDKLNNFGIGEVEKICSFFRGIVVSFFIVLVFCLDLFLCSCLLFKNWGHMFMEENIDTSRLNLTPRKRQMLISHEKFNNPTEIFYFFIMGPMHASFFIFCRRSRWVDLTFFNFYHYVRILVYR